MKFIIGLFAVTVLLSTQVCAAIQSINGAGATFPYPLYSKWFSEYNKQNPNVRINYQSIGSGAGIKQFISKTVDFGASDAPMKDDEMAQAGAPVLHVPTALGAVVLSYNLPAVTAEIKLTPDIIAEIFLGKITKWSDPKLKAVNPNVNFPDMHITPVYRSDGSGTTAVFTDYLAKVSPEWKKTVGDGKAVKWPVGLGGKGNEGVTGMVKQTPGSIGYVEQVYALTNKIPIASIQNAAGKFVFPNLEAVTSAAESSLQSIPADFRVSITNADGAKSYPISAFTYILIYKKSGTPASKEVKNFLIWSMGKGQEYAKSLAYAPLPTSLTQKVLKEINQLP
jgi:phosphate transport system substrate-binding protein